MHWSRLALTTLAACLPWSTFGTIHLHGRDINAPLFDSYDYIVVGCGISGLVVTNRLSEDPSVNVLCIEAGDADHYEPIIQDPVYVGADIGGIYDWDLSTTPQTQLDGATRPMPQGRVLGGGSILNAMCWNRGGQDDYNAWAALGNPGWDWEGMLPYFIKSETYTPVYSADIAREYSINYNPAVHGTSGPVQVSYPRYFYPQSTNLFAALNYLGVPTEFDPNDGSSAGAAFVPTDLDPNSQTRSDARRTYFDPYVSRPNFHVITGQHVTRILIEGVGSNYEVSNPTPGGNENGNGMNGMASNEGFGFGPGGSTPALDNSTTPPRLLRRQSPATSNLRVTGVEFAANASEARRTITATREVIVAAGSLHSAQLLQLSGIGPSSLLNTYGIPVALDLPGVGNNLQDHCLVGTFYPYNNLSYHMPSELTTNATYNAQAEFEYNTFKTGPWTAGSPNALAFNPLPLISNNSASILSGADEQAPTAYLAPGLDPTVVAGYTLQKESLVRRLAETTVASYEIINNNAGSLTVAVMHPFSRGQCYIHSADPFEPPSIDPRWLTNPVDRQVLIEALLFNRQILATPAMLPLQAAQFVPTVDADEATINAIINSGIRTEFHPSGTCAMLPLEQGGVVDPHLRVHGMQNLRVVDAGIFPMIPASHLQAVVYAVAEKHSYSIGQCDSVNGIFGLSITQFDSVHRVLGFSNKPDHNAWVVPLLPECNGILECVLDDHVSFCNLKFFANIVQCDIDLCIYHSRIFEPEPNVDVRKTLQLISGLDFNIGKLHGSTIDQSIHANVRYFVSCWHSGHPRNKLTGHIGPLNRVPRVQFYVYNIYHRSGWDKYQHGDSGGATHALIYRITSHTNAYEHRGYDFLQSTKHIFIAQFLPAAIVIHSTKLISTADVVYSTELISTTRFLQSAKLIFSADYLRSANNDFPRFAFIIFLTVFNLICLGISFISSDVDRNQPAEVRITQRRSRQAAGAYRCYHSLSDYTNRPAVASTTGVHITVTPASNVLNPTQLSSSVRDALTSGGIPSADASALVSAIIGNFATSITLPTGMPSGDAAAIMSAVQEEQRELQASIEAFIQWLLHFLHLE
ncbi:MAG: hypothetical protein Q9218_004046 [Villophora microphyllina]